MDDFFLFKVHELFRKAKNGVAPYPTLKSIGERLSTEDSLPKFSRTTLQTILHLMGFRYSSINIWSLTFLNFVMIISRSKPLTGSKNNSLIIENSFIVHQRKTFIEKIRKLREENRRIYYLDETYLHKNHHVVSVIFFLS